MAQGAPPSPENDSKPFYRTRTGFTILAVLCSPVVWIPFYWVVAWGPAALLVSLHAPSFVVLGWWVIGIACSLAATVWVFQRIWHSLSASASTTPPSP